MRYDKGHKEATRQRIVEIAARRFRKEGVEAVGVAGLMADAGLTHGGFYNHFPSKEALVQAALLAAGAETRESYGRAIARSGDALEAIVRSYLSTAHRDHAERGCSVASLCAEVARGPDETRQAFAASVSRVVDLLAEQIPLPDPAQRRRRAFTLFATLVGALQLARLATEPGLSEQILADATAAALAQARAPQGDGPESDGKG